MTELPPDDPSTQAGLHARPPITPPSSSRGSASGGDRLAEGTRIGHFTIRRLIGTGGMGRVYQAQQENPRRSVAIKVMNHGLATPASLRRFEFEAQVLARLKHPGIAQIHEVGSHDFGDGGVPWFAMEYIANAKPVTDYALDAKLGLRERLKLFRQACEAVAHGHQRGVIHRDLKPSNLLVDGAGLLKVIDFGVARSTDSDMAAATLQTDVGQLVGTVQYMSPEQFDADPNDLDIRSDVYALGVVLHELLAGQLPYDLRRKPIHEAARIVREEDAPRIAGLPGELQVVVSKALAKDRTQRYGSAAELSQDIERWLEGEPITARAPGVVASVRRLVRRHRALSAAVATAFVVLSAALAVTFHLWRDAQRGWAEAETRERELLASIEAQRQAEARTQQAEIARRQSDLGRLEATYAKAVGDGMAGLARGDAAEVRRALRAIDDLRAAGLADTSRNIESRLLAAVPAAAVRSLALEVGRPAALARLPGGFMVVTGDRATAIVDASTLGGSRNVGPAAGACAARPDGQRLALALPDGSLLLVDAPPRASDGSQDWRAAFSVARRLVGHGGAVRCLAWSADGSTLASGDVTGAVRLWNGGDGAPLRAIAAGQRAVRALLFARDGASLLTASADGRLQRWNPATGAPLSPTADAAPRPVAATGVDAGGGRLAIAFEDGSIEVWEASTMSRRASLRASARPSAVAVDADQVVAALPEGVERIDDAGARALTGLPKDCPALALVDDGRALLATATDGSIVKGEIASQDEGPVVTGLARASAACALPGAAPLVAIAGGNRAIEVWDTLSRTRLASLVGEGIGPQVVAASADGAWIAGAGKDGRVQLWSAVTGERAATLQSEGRPVLALAFDPRGGMLAAGDAAGAVLRWEIPSGKALPPLAGAAPVTTIAFRPGAGAVLAVGAVDGSIRLRDLADGAALAELPGAVLSDAQGQPLEPRALAFSADGGRLACALADGTLRLWAGTSGDAGATRRSAAIGDPGKPLTAIAFDPTGGPTLLAASADGSLRFWSTSDAGRGEPSARELARIDAGAGPVAALALDATASTLACVGADGRVALLRTETPLAVARARESLAQAVEARRAGVQDWYSGGGARGALAEFERTRAGLDPSQVHAVRDLLLRFGPSAPR